MASPQLWRACWEPCDAGVETVRRVLDEGRTIADVRGPHSRTPLHMACSLNSPACAALLLDAGADSAARDDNGQNAAHAAAGSVRYAEDAAAGAACRSYPSADCLRVLADHAGRDALIGDDKFGQNAAHVAVGANNVAALEFLAAALPEADARVLFTARDNNGRTPDDVKTLGVEEATREAARGLAAADGQSVKSARKR